MNLEIGLGAGVRGRDRTALLTSTVLPAFALLTILIARPAFADGGAGGGPGFSGFGGGGGTSASPTGANGSDHGAGGFGGGGGGGGGVSLSTGVGGAGGTGGTGSGSNSAGGNGGSGGNFGAFNPATPINTNVTGVVGGSGQNSGNAGNTGGGGGGGGEGGGGVLITGAASATSNASISGAVGGIGGNSGGSGNNSGNGGNGGAGGAGVVMTAGGTFINNAAPGVLGGAGGTGGNSGDSGNRVGRGGDGGAGGAGVLLTNGGVVSNNGSIQGGAGGLAGTAGLGYSSLGNGSVGAGGAGVVGANLTVSNSGTIMGGLSGDGTTRANAITFTGGINQLSFGNATSGLTGNIDVTGSLLFNQGGTDTTVANIVTGSGSITKLGVHQITLTGVNTYSGLTTVSGGTLALAAGGAIAGGVLNGATFTTSGAVSGGLTNTGIVNANAGQINGAIANNAGTFNIGGAVTSNATFGNASGATLALGGAGTYTLQGLLTNSGVVTVASGGQLVVTAAGITNGAGGSITVAAGGTVHDDLNNAGIVTNNGAYFANVASNTGTVTNNAVWTGTISNAGTFNNAAGATVSGLLTSTAGAATNNGALNGGAMITGGVLTGTGAVTNLTVTGGTFAPGNGTPGSLMAVSGNLAFQSAAQYLVQINPATSSFANVTGFATLSGATVNAIYANGSYVARQYTILTAAGGVTGTFGTEINTNLPTNFHTALSYDANNAYLNLILNFAVPSGLAGNQQNVANALTNFFNSNGGIPLVFGGLTPGGLTQASGETATGTQQTTFDAMTQFMGLLTDPFIAGRGDPVQSSTSDAPQFTAYADNGTPRAKSERDAYAAIYRKAPGIADTFTQRWSVWAAGYGGSQTTDGNAAVGSNTATSRIAGTAVGADYRFSPFTIAGFALAGGGTNFSVANGGFGRSDLFQAGAFIRHTVGPAYISAALAYGWQDITTDRTVTIAGVDRLRAQFNANAFSGRAEAGYRFVTPWMGGIGITPYAAGQFTTFDLPAYAEQVVSGANTFALGYASKSVTATRSELGLRADKSFAMQDAILTLRGRAAWAHDFNPDRSIAATFQTLPGASFVVNGAAQASDSALTTASAEMKWMNGVSVAATFEGEFSDVTRSYAGKGVVRYQW